MFGSLVVVLPTVHEGGQLVLRHGGKDWTIDFTDKFAGATESSVCFVAFFSDIEHEVLPVTSGYRVTLTYNLYHKPTHLITPIPIPTPFRLQLKQALVDMVNDKSKLPDGGYLGFGLAHEYAHTGHNLLDQLLGQLKGSDRVLADVCDELGLRYYLRLLYRGILDPRINLITSSELDVVEVEDSEAGSFEYLREALEGLTIEQVEGIYLVGGTYSVNRSEMDKLFFSESCDAPWLAPFYKDPIAQVLEITPMKSSVDIKSTFMTYGNESELEHFYGTACMLVAVEPADTRTLLAL